MPRAKMAASSGVGSAVVVMGLVREGAATAAALRAQVSRYMLDSNQATKGSPTG